MGLYENLKSIWKRLGINGQINNFSSKELWVLETDGGRAIAHLLPPGFRTPRTTDCDAFKRVDGKPVDGHGNWWKIYDVSTAEVYDKGTQLEVSSITKVAVQENHFGKPTYKRGIWGSPIQLITDVRRNRRGQITAYFVGDLGWIPVERAIAMTCHHEIDNARPVFPKQGRPYIRTKRDLVLPNNISAKGYA